MTTWTGYVAPEGYVAELRSELARAGAVIAAEHGRLLLGAGEPYPAAWAQNVWYDVRELPVPSIKAAARRLRDMQRNWALLPTDGPYRRARLIADQLPHVGFKPLSFPQRPPAAPLGGWTLIAPDRMLAAPATASAFPHGEPAFVEDRAGPPNRAYLKLWEALTVLGRYPEPGATCLDLGAAPGGWSHVLADLGAEVRAVDKAPLDPAVAARPNVTQQRESAFALDPHEAGPVDWLVSDVVCYPARLLDLIRRWLDAGMAHTVIATIKFQGATDVDAIDAFKAIPGGRLMHLHHNKHELTFVWDGEDMSG
jgi:23S rRNA (cytidine2498-2'-O)-methyltransferase